LCNSFIPAARGLFEAIKWLLQQPDDVGVSIIQSFRLSHEDLFFQLSIQKGSFDIKLLEIQTFG
jgi:hypothetical protein